MPVPTRLADFPDRSTGRPARQDRFSFQSIPSDPDCLPRLLAHRDGDLVAKVHAYVWRGCFLVATSVPPPGPDSVMDKIINMVVVNDSCGSKETRIKTSPYLLLPLDFFSHVNPHKHSPVQIRLTFFFLEYTLEHVL
jgi:hypothetical protein